VRATRRRVRGVTHEDLADATGDLVVTATAVVFFRSHRCVFRRGIWPPGHPAATRAAVYATVLEERLLARVSPRADGTAPTIDLQGRSGAVSAPPAVLAR
jgi:hypothetical protein